MKNLIKFSLVFGILTFTSCAKDKHDHANEGEVEKELQLAVDNINKMGSQEIAEGVRLDKAAVEGGKSIHYYYTFTQDDVDSLTTEQIEEFKKMLKDEAVISVKSTPDMDDFKAHDVTLKYSYKDKNGKQLMDFDITPTEYK